MIEGKMENIRKVEYEKHGSNSDHGFTGAGMCEKVSPLLPSKNDRGRIPAIAGFEKKGFLFLKQVHIFGMCKKIFP